MKKIILGLLLLAGAGIKSMAQEPTPTPVSTTTTIYTTAPDSTVYVAPVTTTVVVPMYADRAFRVTYPAATRTMWYKVDDDWYRVTYYDNGPWYTLGYYAPRGESYPISLPVLNNAVPQSVVDAVLSKHSGVYDITETIGSNYQTQYIVRTIDMNGVVHSNRVNASAEVVPM
ncbi:hypothetical protein [Sediminibacterium soli]|uniref:hypothetical protein n=1 Tax=Sediminibacterium soli TaxID=2698829 RepID=UPI00137A10C5|nr:hypothetical protein [Sediminibacterium soli]NCI46364.1 hypothetical protein [Sediminibacterium soli]